MNMNDLPQIFEVTMHCNTGDHEKNFTNHNPDSRSTCRLRTEALL